MKFDRSGLEVLDREECLRLLERVPVGRIVLTMGALPAILPVNFALDDGAIVVRTGAGTKLAAAARNAVVAFEIDDIDPLGETGWSVTAIGRAVEVIDPQQLERARRLPLRPWAPGSRDHYIRIVPEIVSGRRIVSAPPLGRPAGTGPDGTAKIEVPDATSAEPAR